jgi:Asp-tRNA(Asn)/Glu-tRNA(Gln) amidotransferase A subunit family amidase
MGRNVPDTCLLFAAMASDDAMDPLAYTLHDRAVRGKPGLFTPPRAIDLSTLRLAYSADLGGAPTESTVRAAFANAVAGARPLFRDAAEAHPDCTGADEAFEVLRATGVLTSHLEKVQTRPQDCGPNIIANVEEGLQYSLKDHARASAMQTKIYRNFQTFFRDHDVLITPGITVSPRPWRELYPSQIDGKATRTYFHWLSLAYYVTLTGHPAVCLPVGVDANGMPFGLQIVGPRGGDAFVLGVAAAIEEAFATNAALRRPVPDLAKLAKQVPVLQQPEAMTWN